MLMEISRWLRENGLKGKEGRRKKEEGRRKKEEGKTERRRDVKR